MASEKQLNSEANAVAEPNQRDELELADGSGSVVLSIGNGDLQTVKKSESKANLQASARPTGRFS